MATTITIEDVKKARSYMPAATKQAVARLMAQLVTRIVENDAGPDGKSLPPLRVEDPVRRLQCLHGVLCGWYFGSDYERETLHYRDGAGQEKTRPMDYVMSLEQLDKWLEGHPMNQLERLKKEKAVANKVYDILYDFRAFELMLNGAIREEIEKANDPALRMAEMLAAQTTPEELKKAMELLEEMKGGEKADG